MKVKYHTAFSITLSGALYTMFRSWELAVASFVWGVLVDVDHIIEYTLVKGIHLDLEAFIKWCYGDRYKQFGYIYGLFHGWEWVLLLLIVAWQTGWSFWIVGLLIGHGQHLVLDQIGNNRNLLNYFLIWRYKKTLRTVH